MMQHNEKWKEKRWTGMMTEILGHKRTLRRIDQMLVRYTDIQMYRYTDVQTDSQASGTMTWEVHRCPNRQGCRRGQMQINMQ